MKIRKGTQEITYNKDGIAISVVTINDEPSMTRQEFKDEVDANNIIAKYGSVNALPDPSLGVYADLTELPDLMIAGNTVAQANEAFAALPSKLRIRFQNDPHRLLEFIRDPENRDEGTKLGLFEALKPTLPIEQPTTTPPQTKTSKTKTEAPNENQT